MGQLSPLLERMDLQIQLLPPLPLHESSPDRSFLRTTGGATGAACGASATHLPSANFSPGPHGVGQVLAGPDFSCSRKIAVNPSLGSVCLAAFRVRPKASLALGVQDGSGSPVKHPNRFNSA